jgi:type II secretory pathway pseudopilin PulG
VSLLELLIVITIIAILASLLLPAVMFARRASQRTACDNHIHQLRLGMEMYLDALRPMFLAPPDPERPTGWAFAILPFVEESAVGGLFNYHQPPTSAHNVQIAGARPQIFVCPAVPELDSTLPGVGATHYVLVVDDDERRLYDWRNRAWKFQDAPKDTRTPWILSPEVPWAEHRYERPHPSAFDLLGI